RDRSRAAAIVAAPRGRACAVSGGPRISRARRGSRERFNLRSDMSTTASVAADAGGARPAGLHRWFERQASLTPGRVAYVCGSDRATYAQVEAAANQLAAELLRRG